jgi:hypothetical protein
MDDLKIVGWRTTWDCKDGAVFHYLYESMPPVEEDDDDPPDEVAAMVLKIDADALIEALNQKLAAAEAEKERLREALKESKLQIEYLHSKFSETGTGNAVLCRIDYALAGTPPAQPREQLVELTPEEAERRVKERYPGAWVGGLPGSKSVWRDWESEETEWLGNGATESEAWLDAARKLEGRG